MQKRITVMLEKYVVFPRRQNSSRHLDPLSFRRPDIEGGAAVIFEAQEMALSFQNGNGNRGLETSGLNHYAVGNESLKHIFRVYSADKQYGIYMQIPIHTANLLDPAPRMTIKVEDILEYNQQVAGPMNALTPEKFTPNLDLLDALVASIYVGTR